MINLIVAVAKNGVIGKNESLPWCNSADLQNFKKLTMDGIVFVGKNTARTLPMLHGREIVVVHKDEYPMLSDINEIADNKNKIGWIIGGGKVYKAALDGGICKKIYMTVIHQDYDGDTYFVFDFEGWSLDSESILSEIPLTILQIWNKNE